ncbi:RNase H domain-containing protein [Aphis craccivora]|uniref:RNase H domain-containing protein n=1 Tax=Aphis craccivora TaxID=307492 RepID=A0A6G0YPS7_APHCR|nr:RNase H domain-containing protein [Aphis craccivora]
MFYKKNKLNTFLAKTLHLKISLCTYFEFKLKIYRNRVPTNINLCLNIICLISLKTILLNYKSEYAKIKLQQDLNYTTYIKVEEKVLIIISNRIFRNYYCCISVHTKANSNMLCIGFTYSDARKYIKHLKTERWQQYWSNQSIKLNEIKKSILPCPPSPGTRNNFKPPKNRPYVTHPPATVTL